MKLLRGFVKFLYDLVVGDCWQVTAAILFILAAGVALLRFDSVPPALFVICLGAVIIAVAPLIILLETRAGMRRSDERITRETN